MVGHQLWDCCQNTARGDKEQGAESMKQNILLLVHNDQKIRKQGKDRKCDNNKEKNIRVQESVQRMTCRVMNISINSPVR